MAGRSPKPFMIEFEPVGRRGTCRDGQTLLDCARQLGVELVSLCGGKGTCGKCRVQVLDGHTTEPTSVEREALSEKELQDGFRLACQTYPSGNCRLHVPPESLSTPQRTQVEGLEVDVTPEPAVTVYEVTVEPPSLEDHAADAERLLEALERQHNVHCGTVDLEVLRHLSPSLRSSGWHAGVSVRGDEVVAVGPCPGRGLGLAVDLGTTKIACYIVDLSGGRVLASRGIMNPQIGYGEDVIARISYAGESRNNAVRLQHLAVKAINETAADLCAGVDAEPRDIVEAVIVGNTAMHHLLAGLPVKQLALSPYVPAVRRELDIKARELGLIIAPGAYVHLLPTIAGFVGADHVSMLLATKMWQKGGVVLALDIGTNTEVCLSCNSAMNSVSCASGPAFEGAHIEHGMRAAEGAIEHLRISDDMIEYQTVGGAPPVGLCGSGILDAVAQLHAAKVLGDNGRMIADHPRVRNGKGGREFVLAGEAESGNGMAITISQGDIREIQLAKGAIRTGIQVLLEASGRSEDDIDEVIIAGAFGSYIDIASAVGIGMLPPLPLDRFRQVGNAAGTGARMALISQSMRRQAQDIAGRVGYIELAANPKFTQLFAQASYLGTYGMADGKRKTKSSTG